MSFSKRFALKERVFVVVAIGFLALISTSLLVQLNFSRFSDFAENFYQTQLPLVENAHDLEHASIRISALAKNLRHTDKQSDLDTLYLEFTREVKELEKLTNYKLFHNHMTIEMVAPFFSYGTPQGRKLVNVLREEFFKAFVEDWVVKFHWLDLFLLVL